jgi:hypothetical protein
MSVPVADISLYKNLYLDKDGRVGLASWTHDSFEKAVDARTNDIPLGTVCIGVRDGAIFAEVCAT